MMVGSITLGASSYDDSIWSWLGKHADLFDAYGDEIPDLADTYDFWRAWGLFALAGCEVKGYGNEDAPPPYASNWGDGVNITFDGTADELLARLDSFLPNAEWAALQAKSRELNKRMKSRKVKPNATGEAALPARKKDR